MRHCHEDAQWSPYAASKNNDFGEQEQRVLVSCCSLLSFFQQKVQSAFDTLHGITIRASGAYFHNEVECHL